MIHRIIVRSEVIIGLPIKPSFDVKVYFRMHRARTISMLNCKYSIVGDIRIVS